MKDYFSTQSDLYRSFRPTYPDALFAFLAERVGPDARVWDCATGNGQAASALGRHVRAVIASDQSAAQLARRTRAPRVHYIQAFAEAAPLRAASIDLVTVAQALHWFDFEAFYAEVDRVLKPGGLFAAWTYSFSAVADRFEAEIEAAIHWFYRDIVGPYWPPERRWVDEQYVTIPFPFEPVATPVFTIPVAWNLRAMLGYVESWSAVQRYKDDTGRDPMPLLAERVAPAWGEAGRVRHFEWPLAVRLGRRSGA